MNGEWKNLYRWTLNFIKEKLFHCAKKMWQISFILYKKNQETQNMYEIVMLEGSVVIDWLPPVMDNGLHKKMALLHLNKMQNILYLRIDF